MFSKSRAGLPFFFARDVGDAGDLLVPVGLFPDPGQLTYPLDLREPAP